jgi:hypothetical protein
MVLGVLEASPQGIQPMPISVSHQFSAEPVILAGWGYDGMCFGRGQAWTLRYDTGVLPPPRFTSNCCFEYNQAIFNGECLTVPPNTDWVLGNLHDSGAPIIVESPGPTPGAPTELRVVGIVQSLSMAQKVSAWNAGGGQPPLTDTDPTNCIGDFDRNGRVSASDLLGFVDAFISGDSDANVDGRPGITTDDLIVFLTHYIAGC